MARNWWKLWMTFLSWLIFHWIRGMRAVDVICGMRVFSWNTTTVSGYTCSEHMKNNTFVAFENIKYVEPVCWDKKHHGKLTDKVLFVACRVQQFFSLSLSIVYSFVFVESPTQHNKIPCAFAHSKITWNNQLMSSQYFYL